MVSERGSNHPHPSGKLAGEVDWHWQGGFTLLELIVAMAIFAMLAVAGWQVFDSINRSKERAQLQSAVLTDLQYGYQQIQRDMLQTVAYQLPKSGGQSDTTASNGGSGLNVNNHDGSFAASQQPSAEPAFTSGFSLQSNQLSFIRYADPDPRYQQAANLEKIVYTFNDGNLIRQRYTSLSSNSNERPLTSVIISGVDAGQFQVLLPEPSGVFPATDSAAKNSAVNAPFAAALTAQNGGQLEPTSMLPRGVSVAFTLPMGNIVIPISWVYALAKAPPTPSAAGLNPQSDS